MRQALSISMFVCLAGPLFAAEVKEQLPGDKAVRAYMAKETEKIDKAGFSGMTSPGEWESARPELERQYLDMLGLWPLPEKTPLKAQTTGVLAREGFRVEKVHFQS